MVKERFLTGKQIRIRTVLSLVIFIIFIAGCIYTWKILHSQPRENGALQPLRKGLNINESVFSSLFKPSALSKIYTKEDAAKNVRVNGLEGLKSELSSNWNLQVIRQNGDTLNISLEEIRALPKTEIIFEFKCIEGWSQVSHWAGVKFSDLVKRYNLEPEAALAYTGLETPDKRYYVGIDHKSMMHPQTLLSYEMNGQPLTLNHGYPLRLIIPVKYGVKHLKRIGVIHFSNERPRDYWYERGYDYYCGL